MSKAEKKAKNATPLGTHLLAGGTAGLMEALVCHPLDTIKVRMQLSKSGRGVKGVSGREDCGRLWLMVVCRSRREASSLQVP
jgi:solute carrier family 25 citrate transporter 1